MLRATVLPWSKWRRKQRCMSARRLPLSGRRWTKPWMLAGGLTPDNVAKALRLTGARQVDVSSGVESAPGVKDPERMRAFVDSVRAATED